MSSSPSSAILPNYANSALSHILSAHDACHVLGHDTIRMICKTFLRCIASYTLHPPAGQQQVSAHGNAHGNASNNSTSSSSSSVREIQLEQISDNLLLLEETNEETYWIDLFTAALFYNFDTANGNGHGNGHGHDNKNGNGGHHGHGTNTSSSKTRPTTKSSSSSNSLISPATCQIAWHRLLNLPHPKTLSQLSLAQIQSNARMQILPPFYLGLDKTLFRRGGIVLRKHHPDHKKTRLRMKYQYAFVMIGVMIAFFTGGFTYQHLNINGVAVLGIILEGLALIAVFIFLCLPGNAVKEGSTTSSPSIVQENEKVNFPIKTPSRNNNEVIEVIEDVESGHADSNKHVLKQARKSIFSFDIPTTSNDEGQEEKDYEETQEDYYLNSSSAGSHTTDHDVPFTYEKLQDKAEKTKEGDTVDDEKEEFLNIDGASNDMDILTSETTTTKGDDTERTSANLRGSLFRMSSKQLSRMIITTNSEYPTCDLPATWVNWLLCFTFGIEALMTLINGLRLGQNATK